MVEGNFIKEDWQMPINIKSKIRRGILSGDRVVVRTPGRIDFAGGWTDTPPYPFENQSAVLNSSVSFGHQWMIEVEIQKAEYFGFIENEHLQSPPIDNIIMIKVLEYLDLSLPPILINIKNSVPKGSGLGGSSLLSAAIMSALLAYSLGAQFVIENPGLIVNGVLMIEQMLGSGGGWQDQIGGIMPGIKIIETEPETASTYKLSYLSDLVADRLSDRSLVLNTGIRRRAANVLEPIRDLYIKKDQSTLDMLAAIRQISEESFQLLEAAKIDDFAQLVTTAWHKVIDVETRHTVPLIGQVAKLCGKSLAGYKISGAGGGGFAILIFVSEDARNKYEIEIQDKFPHATVLRPIFGRYGMVIHQGNDYFRMPKTEQI